MVEYLRIWKVITHLKLLAQKLAGETEGNKVKPQNSWYPVEYLNGVPIKQKSGALPLHQSAQ
jgi:hypothetical protein